MAREFAKKFYASKEWRRCRKDYFAYRHGVCERCGEAGKIVHHKKYITPRNIDDPNITLCWDNLELVCDSCHELEHKNIQDFYFDEEGNIKIK